MASLEQAAVEERLRRLSSACAVPAAAAIVAVGALGWTAERDGGAAMLVQPPEASFLLALGALLLVLLSSAAQRRILRRAVDAEAGDSGSGPGIPASDGPDGPDGSGGSDGPGGLGAAAGDGARLLSAYSWATGIGFGMLGAAVVLGALVGLFGRAPFYGLVICLAGLLAMTVRWPRYGGFEAALERERGSPGTLPAAEVSKEPEVRDDQGTPRP